MAFLGLAGELGAIASLGSRGTAVGKTFSSRALGSNAEGGITTLADYYPPNGGALGKWNNVMAKEGQVFSRYGPTTGRYASDVGLPFSARALPHEIEVKDYFEFQAIRPFMMQSSSIGPGFGKIGFGTQYKMPTGIDYLREFGYIKFLK
ncbi:TNT domain-containing protein [Pedobacter sp. UC225_65]|uniref:TNT domain-containing protein n=1 Tax=Pedobacter sp. UC225_65 TaxID=3350173 RepID=UPI00366FE46F